MTFSRLFGLGPTYQYGGKYFKCDGDGAWIPHAIAEGTIQFVHDGSYIRKVATKVCSAAFIIRCSRTHQQASGTLVEKCNEADNYRAEALGSVAGLLVLKVTTVCRLSYLHRITAHCDNMGTVKHGNAPDVIPPEKQVQVDLIILIKHLSKKNYRATLHMKMYLATSTRF